MKIVIFQILIPLVLMSAVCLGEDKLPSEANESTALVSLKDCEKGLTQKNPTGIIQRILNWRTKRAIERGLIKQENQEQTAYYEFWIDTLYTNVETSKEKTARSIIQNQFNRLILGSSERPKKITKKARANLKKAASRLTFLKKLSEFYFEYPLNIYSSSPELVNYLLVKDHVEFIKKVADKDPSDEVRKVAKALLDGPTTENVKRLSQPERLIAPEFDYYGVNNSAVFDNLWILHSKAIYLSAKEKAFLASLKEEFLENQTSAQQNQIEADRAERTIKAIDEILNDPFSVWLKFWFPNEYHDTQYGNPFTKTWTLSNWSAFELYRSYRNEWFGFLEEHPELATPIEKQAILTIIQHYKNQSDKETLPRAKRIRDLFNVVDLASAYSDMDFTPNDSHLGSSKPMRFDVPELSVTSKRNIELALAVQIQKGITRDTLNFRDSIITSLLSQLAKKSLYLSSEEIELANTIREGSDSIKIQNWAKKIVENPIEAWIAVWANDKFVTLKTQLWLDYFYSRKEKLNPLELEVVKRLSKHWSQWVSENAQKILDEVPHTDSIYR